MTILAEIRDFRDGVSPANDRASLAALAKSSIRGRPWRFSLKSLKSIRQLSGSDSAVAFSLAFSDAPPVIPRWEILVAAAAHGRSKKTRKRTRAGGDGGAGSEGGNRRRAEHTMQRNLLILWDS